MSRGPVHYFFAGIGGMGMAPLALYVKSMGHQVGGIDDALSAPVKTLLEAHGIELYSRRELPSDVDCLVVTSALSPHDALAQEARKRGLKLFRRGDLLAELSRHKKFLAVVGSHGKTTTTGMLIHLICEGTLESDYVLGGLFKDSFFPPAAYQSSHEWLIAEVDESDGTIEQFSPDITVLLNVDWDHPTRYQTADSCQRVFGDLIQRTKSAVIVPASLRSFAQDNTSESTSLKLYSWGEEANADLRMFQPDLSVWTYQFDEDDAHPLAWAGMGAFNRRNALAALLAYRAMGGRESGRLEPFPGLFRRQSYLLDTPPCLVAIQDYAHHPSEIKALLEGVGEAYPDWHLHIVFQPHRYSRTSVFKRDLAAALGSADRLYLMPVYAASEVHEATGTHEALGACFDPEHKPIMIEANQAGISQVTRGLEPMTILLFIGAGDIYDFSQVWKESYLSEQELNHPREIT